MSKYRSTQEASTIVGGMERLNQLVKSGAVKPFIDRGECRYRLEELKRHQVEDAKKVEGRPDTENVSQRDHIGDLVQR